MVARPRAVSSGPELKRSTLQSRGGPARVSWIRLHSVAAMQQPVIRYPSQFRPRQGGYLPASRWHSLSPRVPIPEAKPRLSFQSRKVLRSSHHSRFPKPHRHSQILVRARNFGQVGSKVHEFEGSITFTLYCAIASPESSSYLVSSTGSPTDAASAIVPGPALVTRISAATIYSGMLEVNPRPITSTFPTLPLVFADSSA